MNSVIHHNGLKAKGFPSTAALNMNSVIHHNGLKAKGFPSIAVSAVFGGPVLNTFVGVGLAVIVGVLKYGEDLVVVGDVQLYFGISVRLLCGSECQRISVKFFNLPSSGPFFFGGGGVQDDVFRISQLRVA
jgi:hypothetical protein